MNAKTFDGAVYTNMLAAMRQQAQGLTHLARLVTDLQQQVERLSRKQGGWNRYPAMPWRLR